MPVKTETVTFITPDQASNQYTEYTPPTPPPNTPLVLCVPAMGVRASFYQHLARAWTEHGCIAVTCDWRGIGESSVRASRRSDFGYRHLLDDLNHLTQLLHERHPERPIVLCGHSLGGQLGLLFSALHPERVAAVITVAACNLYYRGFPNPLGIWCGTQFLCLVAHVLGYMPGQRLGFAGQEAKTVIRDWARNARSGAYRVTGIGDDVDAALAQLTLPVMLVSFAEDKLAPRRAVDFLQQKLTHADTARRHFVPADFDGQALGHFDWARQPDALTARLHDWLHKRLPGH